MSTLSAAVHAAILGTLALAVSALSAVAQVPQGAPAAPSRYESQLVAEANSSELCEAVPNRVHVTYAGGSECIAYYISSGPVIPGPTVFYFHGDVPLEDLALSHERIDAAFRTIQRWSESTLIRFVQISRPGLFGSSGNHGLRRRPSEMLAMNAAVDAIKARHAINQIVLSGQSGGSTVAASLLTLGRNDVACAVLGSGGFEVINNFVRRGNRLSTDELRRVYYDPSERSGGIIADNTRRIFVIGDPTDTRTLFVQQQSFADVVRSQGHHAITVQAIGTGHLMHGLTYLTLPVAGYCARGVDDGAIGQYTEAERLRLQVRRATTTP